ncbi:tyrosine-type recombinase/integrase [Candidatus Enterococcus clewellii]|uniref:Integrase/recombinase XerD n=1 Tax=Candidatus Enterococcus clewellii TaxID=1834193 RepID=A0A242KC40_9ENTE|nr:tyrosine-type recombinase/integrase [Enterococcus sp. 9E7_DIV0242]OTP18731.1 hypothetical protein A5888_000545 [Enterococcus sp. 9E7_DIV0242]
MAEKIALLELLPEFTFTDKARGLSAGTIAKHKKVLSVFFKFINSNHQVMYLNEVKLFHVRSFVVDQLESGLTESYVNTFIRSIRAFFVFCENEGYIDHTENPCTRLKWLKEQKKVIKAYSDTDVKKMLKYVYDQTRVHQKNNKGLASRYFAERDRFILMTLADTGLRVSELCNLTDATFNESGITVVRGKGKKDRFMYTSAILMKQKMKYDRIKKQYFEAKPTIKCQDYVFLTKDGNRITVDMVQRSIKKIGKLAGIDETVRCSPHTFRHYFTQAQIANGASIYTLQKLLGHSSVKTTEIYLASLQNHIILDEGKDTSPLMNIGSRYTT